MRVRRERSGISAHAIAGTHVVLFGLDATNDAARGLLGFAIERQEGSGAEWSWLRNSRCFAGDVETIEDGSLPTLVAPIQAFLWGDYTVQPGARYTYRIIPLYGQADRLKRGRPVPLSITTEAEQEIGHSVFFNRGVAGSQAYSRAFGEYRRWYKFERYGRSRWREFIRPDDVPGGKAWDWLARGLDRALYRFTAQARNRRYALRAAVYEFDHLPVIQAFVDALERGADVKVIYHAKLQRGEPASPGRETEAALRKVGLKKRASIKPFEEMMLPRRRARIAHNKFIVLLKDGQPREVWTGSANFTAGGFYGQSNVGHVIRDEAIAAVYLRYWERLATDPRRRTSRSKPAVTGIADWNEEECPNLVGAPRPESVTVIFSPRTSLSMLEWYAQQIAGAEQSVHLTAAFGVSQQIAARLVDQCGGDVSSPYLRYILLEGKPSARQSANRKERAIERGGEAPLDYYDLLSHSQNRLAVGSLKPRPRGPGNRVGLQESLSGLDTHVEYLHTKYILLDPLTEDPTVITGSANFSESSILQNDENMLVIRGSTRVADIYLTEFMRLFRHFRSREQLASMSQGEQRSASFLVPSDDWTKKYYEDGAQERAERLLFR